MTEIAVPGVPAPPQEMILAIAEGMHEPVDVAFRFGYSKSEYEALEQNKYFVAAVMSARAELERSGHPIKLKARFMTESLLDEMYVRAKSPNASLGQVLDAIKVTSKLGDLEPKPQVEKVAPGQGTTVQIIFSGNQADVVIGQSREQALAAEQMTFEIPMPEKDENGND